jgi:hypothetical protein
MFMSFQYQLYEESRVQTLGVKHKVLSAVRALRKASSSESKQSIIWPSDMGVMLLLSQYFTSTSSFRLKVYGNHSANTLHQAISITFLDSRPSLGSQCHRFEARCDDLVSSSNKLTLFYHRK